MDSQIETLFEKHLRQELTEEEELLFARLLEESEENRNLFVEYLEWSGLIIQAANMLKSEADSQDVSLLSKMLIDGGHVPASWGSNVASKKKTLRPALHSTVEQPSVKSRWKLVFLVCSILVLLAIGIGAILSQRSTRTLTHTSNQGDASHGADAIAEKSLFPFRHRMKITFSGYTKSTTLTNFPVLVVLSEKIDGFYYSDFASNTGGDLRFADSNQTAELNYEIEKWDTNGNSYVWVQVPKISGTNTFIWVCWGGDACATSPAYTTSCATWSESYASVWHFNELKGKHKNSVSGEYKSVLAAVTKQGSAKGQIDGADDLSGGGTKVQFPNIRELSGVTKFTISGWTRIDTFKDWATIVNMYSASENRIQLEFSGGGNFGEWHDVDLVIGTGAGRDLGYTTGDILTPLYGKWTHWAMVFNGAGATAADRLKLYINGTNCILAYNGLVPTQTQINTQPLDLCSSVDCSLDEVRISSVNRPSSWLWACWMNQASNTVFNSYSKVMSQK